MTTQAQVIPFGGGLDVMTPLYAQSPGTCVEALNYEAPILGGYRRIDGYTLFDGSDTPAAVPGIGPVRGVCRLGIDTYAFRDQVSGGGMFRASLMGWVPVDLGVALRFDAGTRKPSFGPMVTVTGATSGATATLRRVGYDGGNFVAGNATGTLALTGVVGVFVDDEDLDDGMGVFAKANGTVLANTLASGGMYRFDTYNFFGQAATERLYGANGVNEAFEFDGEVFTFLPNGVTAAFPIQVVGHQLQLFAAYQGGSLIHSAPGEPANYLVTDGAGEIATGTRVSEIKSVVGNVLMIGGPDRTNILYGSLAADFELRLYSDTSIRSNTMQDMGALVVVLTNAGVQALSQTQSFGDFATSSLSLAIESALFDGNIIPAASASLVSRKKGQYRLWFGDRGFYFTFGPEGLSGVMPVRFPHRVECTATGTGLLGEEQLFFGSDTGEVFQLDRGLNFAGVPIPAYLKLPFLFQGATTRRKQYRRMVFDLQGEGTTTLQFRAEFDLNIDAPTTRPVTRDAGATDSTPWETGLWDEFVWSAPSRRALPVDLRGIGENMSLFVRSVGNLNTTHTLFGVTIHFSPRRLQR